MRPELMREPEFSFDKGIKILSRKYLIKEANFVLKSM